jgi:hypothetical protein
MVKMHNNSTIISNCTKKMDFDVLRSLNYLIIGAADYVATHTKVASVSTFKIATGAGRPFLEVGAGRAAR